MSKRRVKWLRKHFEPFLDEENPKGDFRKVKKWWDRLPMHEQQELVAKSDHLIASRGLA
jgi:hypothetical protein